MIRVVIRLLLCLWMAACVIATRDRVALWALGERALWADAVAHAPEKPRPWLNLGRQYAMDGQTALAVHAYRMAMTAATAASRAPDERVFGRGTAAVNLALLYCNAGNVEAARAITASALQHRPALRALQEVDEWLTQERAPGQCLPPSLF